MSLHRRRRRLAPERLERIREYADPWPLIWASGIVWIAPA